MHDAKLIAIPLANHISLSKMSPHTKIEAKKMKRIPHATRVGSLMQAMVYYRLDLAHTVSQVSRFMGNCARIIGEHWRASSST